MFKRLAIALIALSFNQLTLAETVLVTGANSGIGLALATQYAEQGWDVIATHRRDKTPETLAALSAGHDSVTVEKLDVTSGESVDALAAKLEGRPIDILLNNAGVISLGTRDDQALGTLDHKQFDIFMHTNVRGPIMVTEALYENVKASSLKKVVMISSVVGSIEMASQGGRPGGYWYKTSKTALNMLSTLLANDGKADGIAVGILHPGRVNTSTGNPAAGMTPPMGARMGPTGSGMGGGQILVPAQSAEALIQRIEDLSMETSGKFVSYTGDEIAW